MNGQPKRTTISVEFSDLGFRVLAPGDLSDVELDSTLDLLYSRVQGQENNQLGQVRFRLELFRCQKLIHFFRHFNSWKTYSGD